MRRMSGFYDKNIEVSEISERFLDQAIDNSGIDEIALIAF